MVATNWTHAIPAVRNLPQHWKMQQGQQRRHQLLTGLFLVGALLAVAGGGLYLYREAAQHPLPGIPRVAYTVRPVSRVAPITCADFRNQADAQLAYRADPVGLSKLDANNNGIACESLPGTVRAGTRDLVPVPQKQ